jgi:hypothetical protein
VPDTLPVESPAAPEPPVPGASAGRRRPRLGTILALGICLVIGGTWAVAYIWGASVSTPDRLSDRRFPQAAEPICRATVAKLNALPPAHDTPDHLVRAGVVAQSNTDLRAMLSQLDEKVPASGQARRSVQQWLDDYRTFVGDREAYAERLAKDAKARFYVTEKPKGQQITIPVDTFAHVNGMESCITPDDLS